MSKPPPAPPYFDGNVCTDDCRIYRWTPWGRALRVRRATFWSALWNYGLDEALTPRARRRLEGRHYLYGWTDLGEYRGVTGELSFEGPMSSDDIREMIAALEGRR